jgi:hypothetical protein
METSGRAQHGTGEGAETKTAPAVSCQRARARQTAVGSSPAEKRRGGDAGV